MIGSRYYRNARGKVIHKASCRYAPTLAPWWFAEDMSDDDVRSLVADTTYPWLQLCKGCWT